MNEIDLVFTFSELCLQCFLVFPYAACGCLLCCAPMSFPSFSDSICRMTSDKDEKRSDTPALAEYASRLNEKKNCVSKWLADRLKSGNAGVRRCDYQIIQWATSCLHDKCWPVTLTGFTDIWLQLWCSNHAKPVFSFRLEHMPLSASVWLTALLSLILEELFVIVLKYPCLLWISQV